jgi:hypothetical protein
MGLNAAGLDALLNDGNEAVFYAAIGDGTTSGDEVSNERVQLTLGAPSSGIITVTNTPLSFTGTASGAATHVLLFSASSNGTFYGFKALTGDQTFNSSGDYSITSLTFTATSSS